jgi:transcriptional regulator with XRE-family HTH domain/SOS-response transcriptional repressor LexA
MEMGLSRRTIGSVIRQWRIARGLSLERLAERAGCAKSYLSEIENGRRPAPPSVEVLGRIEAALGLSDGMLVEIAVWERTPGQVRRRVEELETRERVVGQLVDLVTRLTGEGAARPTGVHSGSDGKGSRVGRSLDAVYKSGELRKLIDEINPGDGAGLKGAGDGRGAGSAASHQNAVSVPLPMEIPLINAVAAGYPTEFTDLGYPARVADEYVRSPDLNDPDAFAARVVGESMLPEYKEGDIVIFSPACPVRSGMDCFVRLERDHESTFKRVFFQRTGEDGAPEAPDGEWIRLQPLNRVFQIRILHREDVAGIYAAVSVTRALAHWT